MLLTATRKPRVLFVGGKGGVGKTSTSSALALTHAARGDRVLLVSTDPAHNLGHVWGTGLGDEPRRLFEAGGGSVDAVEINPQATVDRHLASVGDMMRQLLPERMQTHAAQHLALAREAPGLHESAVLERIADLVSLGLEHYDRVIFDTAPTGHTLRLLQLPEQLTGWTETLLKNRDRSERFGAAMRGLTTVREDAPVQGPEARLRATLLRRRDRFATLSRVLSNPDESGFLIVLTPERIPITESLELTASLDAQGMHVLGFVVNRRSPDEGGGLLAERRQRETTLLEYLRGEQPGALIVEVPLLSAEPLGVQGLEHLGAHFTD